MIHKTCYTVDTRRDRSWHTHSLFIIIYSNINNVEQVWNLGRSYRTSKWTGSA